MARVLMISHVPLTDRITAPGVRCMELGRELSSGHDVTIAGPTGSNVDGVRVYDPRRPGSLAALMSGADIVFSQPLEPRLMAAASRDGRRWIVDLINPDPIEGLEHQRHKQARRRRWLEQVRIDRLTYASLRGSAFACGNERQLDMWLGFLAAARRLGSADYTVDRELRRLIDLVPSGIPVGQPVASPDRVLRGEVFPHDARILVWNGGVWDWLDATVVVEALAHLRARDPRWVLLFTAVSPPHSDAGPVGALRDAMASIEAHGFGAGVVHINDTWTPYAHYGDLLLQADVGVSAHPRSLEARFAFRNRILDLIWARLPMVCTEGDQFASEAASHGWGEAVPPGDAVAFAAAAERVATAGRDHYRQALDAAAERYSWVSAGRALDGLIATSAPPPHHLSTRLTASMLASRHSTAAIARDLVGWSP